MSRTNRATIHAPLNKVFLAAADLTRWPEFLPHYRHNRFLSQTPSGGVVHMSCVLRGIPFAWLSEFCIDPEKRELSFLHVRAALNATRGMEVTWSFQENGDGSVEVVITHQLALSWPLIGPFVANRILGDLIIPRIAEMTLAGLKRKLEAQARTDGFSAPRGLSQSADTAGRPRKRSAVRAKVRSHSGSAKMPGSISSALPNGKGGGNPKKRAGSKATKPSTRAKRSGKKRVNPDSGPVSKTL